LVEETITSRLEVEVENESKIKEDFELEKLTAVNDLLVDYDNFPFRTYVMIDVKLNYFDNLESKKIFHVIFDQNTMLII
jgi:hypothetical protein